MMPAWQLQDAKARLSEVIQKAAEEGPQSLFINWEAVARKWRSETLFAENRGE
jgi:hypothetical protein